MTNAAMPDPALLDRDPMLAHALAAHGAKWSHGQTYLSLPGRGDATLPEVTLRVFDHRLQWRHGDALTIATQRHKEVRHGVWTWETMVSTGALPDAMSCALLGRTLDALLDVPGADAWLIDDVVAGAGSTLVRLDRIRTS